MSKGERLEKLIKESPYKNVSRFSKASGVPYTTIKSFIERDLNKAAIDSVVKIAKTLNVSVEYLIEEEIPLKQEASSSDYPYLPVHVAAGLPEMIDPVSEDDVETISIPDAIMGKWAGSDDIYIMRVNGESMNKIIPNHSLIAVKKIDISNLQNGDIVVYSNHYEYSVKRFYKFDDRLVFKPHSTDVSYSDNNVPFDSYHNIKIHGKVVLYIVNLD